MNITVEQLNEKNIRRARIERFFQVILTMAFFALILFATGNLSIGQSPVFIEVIIVYSLLGTKPIKKMLGEFERPQRSKFNKWLTFIFIIVLFIPIAYFMLNATNALSSNINFATFKWEHLLILTPGPLLLAVMRQLQLTKDNEINNKIIISASKKIIISSICLICFFPIILIVMTMGINPVVDLAFSKPEYWATSFFFWSASFLFYSGVILLLFSIGDIFSLLEEGT